MHQPQDELPVNPLPPVVTVLALAIFGVEVFISAGERGFIGGPAGVGWRLDAIQDWGFFQPILGFMIDTGQWSAHDLARFVTYPFIHAGFLHLVMALVFLLALGKMVGERFSALAFLTVFFGAAIAGATAYGLLVETNRPLIGAYPAVYGLIGAYTFILWVGLGLVGAPQARAFSLIGMLLAIQLLFSMLFGGGPDWIADLFGFLAGFALSFLVSPGGWERILVKLRQR